MTGGLIMPEKIKKMDIQEFLDGGFLQEANRVFFHPLGLALEVTVPTEPGEAPACISGVWDYREDPEGMCFANYSAERLEEVRRKQANVSAEYNRHVDARFAAFGMPIQQVDQFTMTAEEIEHGRIQHH